MIKCIGLLTFIWPGFNKEQALQKLVYETPNNQLCFITQKAIDKCLKFVEHNILNHG